MSDIASVVISNASLVYDREYHYLIPDTIKDFLEPGMRVLVPFGKSNISKEGFVTDISRDKQDAEGLKKIAAALDKSPVLRPEMLKLAAWMKNKYVCTWYDVLRSILPAGSAIKAMKMVNLIEGYLPRNPKEERIIEILKEEGDRCSFDILKKKSGFKNIALLLKKLEEQNAIEITEEYKSAVHEKYVKMVCLNIPAQDAEQLTDSSIIRSIGQVRVLEILMDSEYVSASDLLGFAGVSSSVLNTLHKKGIIDFFEMEVKRDPFLSDVEPTIPFKPEVEQQTAIDGLMELAHRKEYCEALLFGVTGSGKTEVYMQVINGIIQEGRQAIVLVPEISLTPQMSGRFRSRFGRRVAVLHSRLSPGERYDQWKSIFSGVIDVVVGARSAVFAPLKDPGIIIIDEEHDSSYKSALSPKYNAAEIARARCSLSKSLLVLGSATPAVETYYRALKGKSMLFVIKNRPKNITLPQVRIADMRQELAEGNKSIFSRLLIKELEENIKKRQQSILLLNRRGYASFILCRDCGYSLRCRSCNISMTYHSSNERVICHYCGYTVKAPEACPRCKSRNIRHFGTGTQKVEKELKDAFPDCTVIRMDADTTMGKNAHEKILDAFREENIDILVGTQMIAKGHDFPRVTLVGVLAADAILNYDDFRASEKTFQLITQVSGRAGRGSLRGRVVIQSYNTEDYSITSACHHDYETFFKHEIEVRQKLNYPPFCNIGVVSLKGKIDDEVKQKAVEIVGWIRHKMKEHPSPQDLLGPMRAPLSKIRNFYRWRLIMKHSSLPFLGELFWELTDKFGAGFRKSGVEVGVDINPVSML